MSNVLNEQFYLDRKTGIGGSDVASIMGLSPFKTALQLYYEKIAESFDIEEHDNLRRGRKLEKYILEEYASRTEETIEYDIPLLRHAEYPFLIGHIDGKIHGQNVIIEAKSSALSPKAWENKIPDYYLVQIAHYAHIYNADRVDVPVLFNNWQYCCFSYYRDEELENRIKQACIDFWQNHILKGNPPPMQDIEDGALKYPYSNQDNNLEADATITNKIKELVENSKQIKELEKRETNLKLEIMEYMKDAERLTAPEGCLVSWKSNRQNRLDISALKLDHPEIYSKYLKENEVRPFKIITRG
jgi:putative phage-type endonuclease